MPRSHANALIFLRRVLQRQDKLGPNNSSHFQSGKKIKEKERKNPCGIHGRAHRPGHADPLRRRQRARGKAHGLRRRLGAGGKLHRTRDPWAGIGT